MVRRCDRWTKLLGHVFRVVSAWSRRIRFPVRTICTSLNIAKCAKESVCTHAHIPRDVYTAAVDDYSSTHQTRNSGIALPPRSAMSRAPCLFVWRSSELQHSADGSLVWQRPQRDGRAAGMPGDSGAPRAPPTRGPRQDPRGLRQDGLHETHRPQRSLVCDMHSVATPERGDVHTCVRANACALESGMGRGGVRLGEEEQEHNKVPQERGGITWVTCAYVSPPSESEPRKAWGTAWTITARMAIIVNTTQRWLRRGMKGTNSTSASYFSSFLPLSLSLAFTLTPPQLLRDASPG